MVTIILPKLPHFRQFVKEVSFFSFSSEISFGPLFIDIWRLFTGHTAHFPPNTAPCMSLVKGDVGSYLPNSQTILFGVYHDAFLIFVFHEHDHLGVASS